MDLSVAFLIASLTVVACMTTIRFIVGPFRPTVRLLVIQVVTVAWYTFLVCQMPWMVYLMVPSTVITLVVLLWGRYQDPSFPTILRAIYVAMGMIRD